jgi:hypothetical protein
MARHEPGQKYTEPNYNVAWRFRQKGNIILF